MVSKSCNKMILIHKVTCIDKRHCIDVLFYYSHKFPVSKTKLKIKLKKSSNLNKFHYIFMMVQKHYENIEIIIWMFGQHITKIKIKILIYIIRSIIKNKTHNLYFIFVCMFVCCLLASGVCYYYYVELIQDSAQDIENHKLFLSLLAVAEEEIGGELNEDQINIILDIILEHQAQARAARQYNLGYYSRAGSGSG